MRIMIKSERKATGVTIVDVAEMAGVSTATAARVMGNYGSVSEKTRKRVQDCARELSYVPNAIAKSMRMQHTKTIGMIIGDIQAPFFGKLVLEVEAYASEKGYNLLVCNTNERPERELMHLNSLFEHRVDGIAISSCMDANAALPAEYQRIIDSDTPIIFFDRRVDQKRWPTIQCDNYMGSYEATKYLLSLGHRRIGVTASNRSLSSMTERLAGFKAALADHGLPFDPELVRFCEESHRLEAARAVIGDLLDTHPDITVLYQLNNPLYRATWFELKSRGMEIPKDISLLGWGGEELAEAWEITTVTQPMKRLGRRIAEILFDMIENKTDYEEYFEQMDTELVHRNSCASIK